MRDPKTHAKVLRLRLIAVGNYMKAADPFSDREERLGELLDQLIGLYDPVHGFRRWIYDPYATPPHWRHVEIIPDTEEEA